MELIIGGACQGKTDYAKRVYGLTDAEIFTCEGLELDLRARCLRHLESFALACVRAGIEPARQLATLELADKILICDDISCGIVPLEQTERFWREATGRMTTLLAKNARHVTRIFCGLPLELKG